MHIRKYLKIFEQGKKGNLVLLCFRSDERVADCAFALTVSQRLLSEAQLSVPSSTVTS